jgi:hypothetical protein
MLSYRLSQDLAGIYLTADLLTLQALHEVIHQINDASPIVRDKEGLFFAMAHDVRKACEGRGEVIRPDPLSPGTGVRYAVEMLWPTMLVQLRIMRASLAFMNSSKQQQGFTYLLEAVAESAISEAFGQKAPDVLDAWQRLDPAHQWLEESFDGRGVQFCRWNSAQRKSGMSGLLTSLDPMYHTLYPMLVERGVKHLVQPDVLDTLAGQPWPDPHHS